MARSDLHDPCSLVGTWMLSRSIDDRRLAEVSHVSGRLELTQEAPGRIRWVEKAVWHRQSGDTQVQRLLQVVLVDEAWWVRFEGGRDFHPWSPERPVVHACPPDTYRGLVTGTTDRWTIVWEATGPEKDYRMTTELEPVSRNP